jgi:hypothetical protein
MVRFSKGIGTAGILPDSAAVGAGNLAPRDPSKRRIHPTLPARKTYLTWASLAAKVRGTLVAQALLPVLVLLHIAAMHSQEWPCYKMLYALLA